MKYKIAKVHWVDTTEHKDENCTNGNDNPLIYLLSIGFLVGKFKDKNGTEYVRLCYKFCSEDGRNDDFIDIPIGCIKKIEYIK